MTQRLEELEKKHQDEVAFYKKRIEELENKNNNLVVEVKS